jgi:hypothetical protein
MEKSMAIAQTTSTDNDSSDQPIQAEPAVWVPLLAFILFTIVIISAGYAVFNYYKENIKTETQNNLEGISKLKIKQITDWMEGRRGDAQALKDDPFFLSAAENWLQQGGPDGDTRKKLIERLTSLQQTNAAYGYYSISLFDDKAMLRLSSSADETPAQGIEKEKLLESMRSGYVEFSEIHREKTNAGERIEIELRTPLATVKNGKVRILGVVLSRIDPSRFLFPLIQLWPTSSASAENVLVRRKDDEVIFLNELRHIKNAPLSMRLSIRQPQLLGAMAAMGQMGLVEGVDYRGVPVVGVVSKVPWTTWSLISKIDQAEIYAPINQLAGWTAALLLLLLGAGACFLVFWLK